MPAFLIQLIMTLIIAFFLLFAAIDKTQPFQERAEFYAICDTYNHLAIEQGYLSQSDQAAMIAELSAKGITVTNVTAPQMKLEWGTAFTFKVEAVFSQDELQPDFNKQTKAYALKYEMNPTTLCEE